MADVTLQPRPSAGAAPLAVADGDYLPGFSGNWTAHLEFADQVQAPTGLVTLIWLGQEFQGQVLRSGQSSAGRTFALVAGGDGHLGQPLPPELPARAYRNAPLRIVLSALLAEAGERMSGTIDPLLLSRQLPLWPRRKAKASDLLDDLARELDVIWRVLPDGSVWLGVDSFAEAVLAQPLQALDDQDPSVPTALFVPHAFGPLPGQSYQGLRVGNAHYTISPDAAYLRLWYLDGPTADLDGSNLRRGMAEIIRETLRIDWYGSYPGKVVVQRPDGTLDIQFDTKLIPPLPAVRYRAFAPGARLSVPAGSRVEVHFDNADPTAPVAALFDPGGADKGVARLGDEVDVYAITAPVGMGGATVLIGLSPVLPPPPAASVKVTLKITKASDKVFCP